MRRSSLVANFCQAPHSQQYKSYALGLLSFWRVAKFLLPHFLHSIIVHPHKVNDVTAVYSVIPIAYSVSVVLLQVSFDTSAACHHSDDLAIVVYHVVRRFTVFSHAIIPLSGHMCPTLFYHTTPMNVYGILH